MVDIVLVLAVFSALLVLVALSRPVAARLSLTPVVLLAAIGLYGVRAYTVAMRRREIGIRMALGANASDALRMMLREGLVLTAIGAAVGLVLSVAVGKVLSSLLYRVDSFDPVVLSAAPLLLTAVSLIACYIPARRAARLDPMVALRDE